MTKEAVRHASFALSFSSILIADNYLSLNIYVKNLEKLSYATIHQPHASTMAFAGRTRPNRSRPCRHPDQRTYVKPAAAPAPPRPSSRHHATPTAGNTAPSGAPTADVDLADVDQADVAYRRPRGRRSRGHPIPSAARTSNA